MKKIIGIAAVLLSFTLVFGVLAGCGPRTENPENTPDAEPKKETLKVFTLKGPTGLGMCELMESNEKGETSNKYDFTVAGSPDEITGEIIAGRFDIAAVPVNLAAVLYNKTGGEIRLAAVNTLGVLYVLENGGTVHSVEDLRGKTIGATGQGSTPEYVLNYILKANGLDPEKDVTIEYYAEHAELATRMISGDVKIGMLPEPNVTTVMTKNASVGIALNLTAEWDKLDTGGAGLTQGCVVVSKDFAENYKAQLNSFLDEYKKSAEYAVANPAATGTLAEKFGIVPAAAIAAKAIPNCNICMVTGAEAKEMVSGFLKVLFDADAKSVGGKLPDDGLYYTGY
ncbi:MAG: ABC transporter substrate-binding protein [Clostridia bacterium]|nr:ABC transporter substrate-binding protein [Clostridia bacterium]MBO7503153.1 ABC transporter substrate-binding protein [Clostridia bacterium]MBO7657794.1 ABC transporter substrate-binding protein [Clostridia bacterium]MBP5767117.1 ABC transporter substrate-binding protein [Clostridia bacterium]